jgi:hypothetical protein
MLDPRLAEVSRGGRVNILLLTATIAPPKGAPGLVRTDPRVRLQDYSRALRHYLSFLGHGIDRIVFAENSASDVAALRSIVEEAGYADELEFCLFDGMDHPPHYGRCFSESRLLDRAMRVSTFARDADAEDFFWKVTGRYLVVNLAAMIATRPRGCEFYCDLRNRRSPWADMRLMGWTKAGFERNFAGIGDDIREDLNAGRPGEEALFLALSRRLPLDGVVPRLRREPLFDGVRGFDNKNWGEGRQRLVYHVRQAQRVLFHRVWI